MCLQVKKVRVRSHFRYPWMYDGLEFLNIAYNFNLYVIGFLQKKVGPFLICIYVCSIFLQVYMAQ